MNSILDWFLVWWLRTGRYGWSKLRRKVFERRYLSTALPTTSSLEEIKTCLKDVRWTMDGPLHLFDCISYPQTVWAKKKDDCDGFAILAATLLRQWNPGLNPVLVTAMTRPIRSSHTVCVFASPKGVLWFFDNASFNQGEYETYKEIVSRISEKTRRLVCWDVRNPESLNMLEFHKE
ncbi:hypothetical protein ACFLYF_04225 [Chloroflexota bacterium]